MSRIRVLICRVDDGAAKQMTELAGFDMPETDVSALNAETALDDLEATAKEVGQAILRHLLEAQWEEIDEELVRQYRQLFSP